MIKTSSQLRLTSDSLRGFSEPGWRPPETKTHTAVPAVMFTACSWVPFSAHPATLFAHPTPTSAHVCYHLECLLAEFKTGPNSNAHLISSPSFNIFLVAGYSKGVGGHERRTCEVNEGGLPWGFSPENFLN